MSPSYYRHASYDVFQADLLASRIGHAPPAAENGLFSTLVRRSSRFRSSANARCAKIDTPHLSLQDEETAVKQDNSDFFGNDKLCTLSGLFAAYRSE
jgi:hypothetical protein